MKSITVTKYESQVDLAWEVENLKALTVRGSANVVKLLAAYWDGAESRAVLVMELGTMTLQYFTQLHGKLARPLALQFARDVAAGVAACHELSTLHRDIKPANVVLCPPISGAAGLGLAFTAKLCDFGTSIKIRDGGPDPPTPGTGKPIARGHEAPERHGPLHDMRCTLPYCAPEVLRGGPANPPGDVWSLGMLAWELLSEEPSKVLGPNGKLEKGRITAAAARKALAHIDEMRFPANGDPAKSHVAEVLMHVGNPGSRPTAASVAKALQAVPTAPGGAGASAGPPTEFIVLPTDPGGPSPTRIPTRQVETAQPPLEVGPGVEAQVPRCTPKPGGALETI